MEIDPNKLLDEAVQLAAHIRDGLPEGFDIAMLTLNSKLPFKALSYREAPIHRFSDLASGAADAAVAGRLVSAATLTRGSMETLARAWELRDKISAFSQRPDVDALDKFLMSRLFGSRNNPELPEASNILNAIDWVAKQVPHFRENYDRLSEFAHPNYSGTFQAFASIDRLNFSIKFADSERRNLAFSTILSPLFGNLHGFMGIYNALAGSIEQLDGFFD